MKRTLTTNKLKQFGKITTKTVLVGSLIGAMITSPLCLNALPNNDSNNLCIDTTCTVESFDYTKYYDRVAVINANMNDMNFFDDLSATTLVFENCDFSNCDINLPSSVKEVSFTNCNINNFNGLKDNSNINNVCIDSCNVCTLDGIDQLNNLETLSISNVGIESIDILSKLNNLKELTLMYTCVKSLEPLRNTNINSLNVSESLTIRDFSPIKDMKYLNYFDATNCQMALTEDVYNYLRNSSIKFYFTEEDLNIKNKVKNIANEIFNDTMSDKEKIKAAVNYVVNIMEYDMDAPNNPSSLGKYNESALKYALEGNGCCRNYTALTTALLQEANINVYEVKNDYHIWSFVNVEGEDYWIDSTLIDVKKHGKLENSSAYMTPYFDNLDTNNPITVPSTYYEKTQNTNEMDYTRISQLPSEYLIETNPLADLHIPLGALVGIAMALNLAFKAKEKIDKKKKQKIVSVKDAKDVFLNTPTLIDIDTILNNAEEKNKIVNYFKENNNTHQNSFEKVNKISEKDITNEEYEDILDKYADYGRKTK